MSSSTSTGPCLPRYFSSPLPQPVELLVLPEEDQSPQHRRCVDPSWRAGEPPSLRGRTVCLGSTNNLTLGQLFHLKKWRVCAIWHSSVKNNAVMYDAGAPLFYFFIFFTLKLLTQSAKKCVCMVKTGVKILAEFICALHLLPVPQTPFSQCADSQIPGEKTK